MLWTKTSWKLALFPGYFLTLRRPVLSDGSVWSELDTDWPGAYYPTPITPPGKLSFNWLRGIQDYKTNKASRKKFGPFFVNRTPWSSVSRNTQVREGLSRFVLCVPHSYCNICCFDELQECSIQSEYVNNKQFDGRKWRRILELGDNTLRALIRRLTK